MIIDSKVISRASVAAVVEATGGIGLKNQLPWGKLKGDFAFLKWVTTGQFKFDPSENKLERVDPGSLPTVVFGRNTWESIGKRPLPKRKNIIITSNPEAPNGNIEFASKITDLTDELIYFLGGCGIYKAAMDLVQAVFLTKIGKLDGTEIPCDVYFPLKELNGKFNQEIDITKFVNDHIAIPNIYNGALNRFEEIGYYYKIFLYI
jgi:dihydrofolate reductase